MSVLSIFICIGGFLLAYLPTQMSEAHTNEIVKLYFKDMGYSVSEFNTKWKSKLENYELTSSKGHTIPVTYICADGSYENPTIVLVHWHEANHEAMYPIAEVFLEKGWNVVLYDQRAHGKNTAKIVTFGFFESQDLQQIVDFTYQKSNGATIGALGQSMGAATIAYYSGTQHAEKYLDFAIVDSSFNSMYEEIHWEISKSKIHLPSTAITNLGSAFCQLIYGYSFSDINIAKQIRSNNIPTLIIHSKKDNKCPYYMGEELFNSIPHTDKEFITFNNSEHLLSFWDEKDRYVQSVFIFINKYVK
jgi:predicted alpha/beta-fold hydrolase